MHEAFWNGLFDVRWEEARSDRRPFGWSRGCASAAMLRTSRSGPEGESRWHASKDIIQWLEDL